MPPGFQFGTTLTRAGLGLDARIAAFLTEGRERLPEVFAAPLMIAHKERASTARRAGAFCHGAARVGYTSDMMRATPTLPAVPTTASAQFTSARMLRRLDVGPKTGRETAATTTCPVRTC